MGDRYHCPQCDNVVWVPAMPGPGRHGIVCDRMDAHESGQGVLMHPGNSATDSDRSGGESA